MREKIEKIIFIVALLLLLIISIINNCSFLAIIISLCGVIYSHLIGLKKSVAYLFGIINVSLYGYTLFKTGMYLSGCYNILYSLPILIYGWYYWNKKIEKDKINKLPKLVDYLIFSFIIITIICFIIFKHSVLFYDITTSIYGFIGLFLMSKKYKEQWYIWNVSNILSAIMWSGLFLKLDDPSLMTMWILYSINSIYFTLRWK